MIIKMILNDIIETKLKALDSLNKAKELYELRLCFIKTNYSNKSDYERNEVDILAMKTHLVIDNLNENLAQKKIDFEETFGRFIK